MHETTLLKTPGACTEEECRAFARLVREGFETADARLEGRIRDANLLAFHYAADGALGAIAALKAPPRTYREEVFRQAKVPAGADDYALELGWVYVAPAYRGRGIGVGLCGQLLARAGTGGLFATTRGDNVAMISMLRTLGFARVGIPYPRRDEELVVCLRPGMVVRAPDALATP